MPTQCRVVDPFPGWEALRPGDMWLAHVDEWAAGRSELEQAFNRAHRELAAEYWDTNFANRAPLYVVLPNGDPFCVDQCASVSGNGWTVTGTPPLITVHPSIHAVGEYHGWLQSGVLSDDIDGRVYADPEAA